MPYMARDATADGAEAREQVKEPNNWDRQRIKDVADTSGERERERDKTRFGRSRSSFLVSGIEFQIGSVQNVIVSFNLCLLPQDLAFPGPRSKFFGSVVFLFILQSINYPQFFGASFWRSQSVSELYLPGVYSDNPILLLFKFITGR